ncbi:MAG: branched-chain amino acid ABC transporter permease [Thermoleophilia bacterium]
MSFGDLLRKVWVPLALCTFVVVTWALVTGLAGTVYERTLAINLIYLVLVLALQIFSGNSGVLSFGHVGFMAIGAFVSALLTIPEDTKKATFLTMPGFLDWILDTNVGEVPAILLGGLIAMVFGILFAPPIVRLRGVQAGIGTLAILIIVYVFNIQTTSITRGTSTMIGVPETTSTEDALMAVLATIVVAYFFQQSRRGLRLRALRENERAARSVGVASEFERGVAWVLSTFIAGVAGAIYAHYITAFSATSFYFDITFIAIAMLVVGGLTSVSGAVFGCIGLAVVQEALRRFEVNGLFGEKPPVGIATFGLALILLVTLILRPRGITKGREIPFPTDWTWPGRKQRATASEETSVATAPPAHGAPAESGT